MKEKSNAKIKEKENLILGFLFLKGSQGETLDNLSESLQISKKNLEETIKSLKSRLENEGVFTIKKANDFYRLSINNSFGKILSKNINNTFEIKLSNNLLEILTIIAYKQPVSKPEIDRIRGIPSDYPIKKLLEYELIEENGRSNLPGLPYLYSTTKKFLNLFDLESLDKLPKLDIDKLLQKDTKEFSLF